MDDNIDSCDGQDDSIGGFITATRSRSINLDCSIREIENGYIVNFSSDKERVERFIFKKNLNQVPQFLFDAAQAKIIKFMDGE